MRQVFPKFEIREGHVVLIVEDTEVFDFIDDILIEQHDLEYTYVESKNINGVEVYKLHFPKNIDLAKIQTIIDSVDKSELRRIWNLNN